MLELQADVNKADPLGLKKGLRWGGWAQNWYYIGGYIGFIRGYVGRMEKKMEATISGQGFEL